MGTENNRNYFLVSVLFHAAAFLVLALGFDFAKPLTVIENTNKQDVISAVVLGDSVKSKILPHKEPPAPVPPPIEKVKEVVKEEPKPEPVKPKPIQQAQEKPVLVKKDVIALKKPPVKKLKVEFHPDDLLADIKKETKKQKQLKQVKQKELQAKFAKTLRQQAEKTMRQSLLNEDIKLTNNELHQSQGIVDKYQALIKQAISERWIIPPNSNKKLACTLLIRTAPGGLVLDVQISKSSGDSALDSSARAAVMKSSPLPVPKESNNFEPFRQFALIMKPENYIN